MPRIYRLNNGQLEVTQTVEQTEVIDVDNLRARSEGFARQILALQTDKDEIDAQLLDIEEQVPDVLTRLQPQPTNPIE